MLRPPAISFDPLGVNTCTHFDNVEFDWQNSVLERKSAGDAPATRRASDERKNVDNPPGRNCSSPTQPARDQRWRGFDLRKNDAALDLSRRGSNRGKGALAARAWCCAEEGLVAVGGELSDLLLVARIKRRGKKKSNKQKR